MENIKIDILSIDNDYPFQAKFYVSFGSVSKYEEIYEGNPYALNTFKYYISKKWYGKAYQFIKKWKLVESKRIY